jgi:hypothetical protein
MSVKPLSPDSLNIELPDFVITGVNNAILSKFRGGEFTIKQNEIMAEILKCAPANMGRQEIFEKKWLDFEELYRQHGWIVTYDKPGWDESYEAFFVFKPKNTKS